MNGNEAVVGSANASMNGLGFETAGPNIEAAVHLRDKEIAGKVREWFLREWGLADCVDDALLQAAETLWDKTQKREGAIMRCLITAYLITYESQLPAVGPRWQGFRRLRDDLSGWIDRRFALSDDPPTAIGYRVRAQAEDCA